MKVLEKLPILCRINCCPPGKCPNFEAEASIIAELQSHCSRVDKWKSLDMEVKRLNTTTCLTINLIADFV